MWKNFYGALVSGQMAFFETIGNMDEEVVRRYIKKQQKQIKLDYAKVWKLRAKRGEVYFSTFI